MQESEEGVPIDRCNSEQQSSETNNGVRARRYLKRRVVRRNDKATRPSNQQGRVARHDGKVVMHHGMTMTTKHDGRVVTRNGRAVRCDSDV